MPNDPRVPDQEVAERVVTWHNRMPGARRIQAHHVTGIGVVALPFEAAKQPSAPWKRVLQRLQRTPARFTEPLIEWIGAAEAAAFGWQHGVAIRPGPEGWPLRSATVIGDLAADLQWRYLRTAAVEFGSRRIRVLIGGSGAQAPVLGARHWNRQRVRAMLVATVTAIVMACGSALFVRHEQASAAAPLSEPPAQELTPGAVLDAPSAGSAPEPLSASASLPGPAPAPAPTPAPAPAPAPTTSPISKVPSGDRGRGTESAVTPSARRSISGMDQSADTTTRSPSAAPPPTASPTQKPATSPPPRSGDWSLATRPTRNRAATELRILLINSYVNPRGGAVRVEAVQMRGEWRAVMGPFASREAAEQTRESLRTQGVQLEPVGF